MNTIGMPIVGRTQINLKYERNRCYTMRVEAGITKDTRNTFEKVNDNVRSVAVTVILVGCATVMTVTAVSAVAGCFKKDESAEFCNAMFD
jgi:hypothetical protein